MAPKVRKQKPQAPPPSPVTEPSEPVEPPPSLRGLLRKSSVYRVAGLRVRAEFLQAFEEKAMVDLMRSVERARLAKRNTLLPADV
jgi:hypothetical protein